MSAYSLTPVEQLMLRHIGKRYYHIDMADAVRGVGLVFGHRKWLDAQYIVAFIALQGLERHGLLTWLGSSRALGHKGWHGGVWTLTDAGVAEIARLTGEAQE